MNRGDTCTLLYFHIKVAVELFEFFFALLLNVIKWPQKLCYAQMIYKIALVINNKNKKLGLSLFETHTLANSRAASALDQQSSCTISLRSLHAVRPNPGKCVRPVQPRSIRVQARFSLIPATEIRIWCGFVDFAQILHRFCIDFSKLCELTGSSIQEIRNRCSVALSVALV